MADIFISYSRADRNRVQQLAAALEAAGFSTWWDGDLAGGVEYSREIESRIQAAAAVVVAWSATAVESTWVADEAELARDLGKLVPLVLDGSVPKIGFRQFQTVDFSNWAGDAGAACFEALTQSLGRHVEPAAEADPTPAAARPATRADAPIEIDVGALQPARPAFTPLVGRAQERAQITECLEGARNGQGGILLIGGEPGVGKTRLAEECLALGHELGMLTLTGHAYEERGAPYIIAVEIIEELLRTLPEPALRAVLGENAAEITRLAPGLRDRLPDLPAPLELAPEQQQRYLFNALLAFTRRLSQAAPCVILLDDLHWADDSSMALLEHIAPHVSELPLLYVITYRDVAADMGEPFRRALAALNRLPATRRMAVRQLTVDDVAELLATLGGANPPANLVEILHDESGGNALFVQSVYQSLAEEGRLFDAGGGWRTDVTRDELLVPDDIRLIIERRVDRLGDGTRALLVMAATLGLRFEPDVLEAALGADDDDVIDAIEDAEATNLIQPSSGARETRYEFSHALVRQSLLDMTSPLRRERLHLKAADTLEAVYGEQGVRAASIAQQRLAAGRRADAERTCHFLELAARYAFSVSSFDEAIEHCGAALTLLQDRALQGGEAVVRSRFLAQRGYAFRALGNWTDAERDWLDALALMSQDDDPEQLAKLYWELGFQLVWQNRLAEGATLMETALERIGEAPCPGRARLLALSGHFLTNSGKLEEGDRLQREAIEMARALGDLRLLAGNVMFSRLYHYQHTFNVGGYLEVIDELLEILNADDAPSERSQTMGSAIVGLVSAADFDRVRAFIEEVLPLGLATGDAGTVSQADLFGGMIDTAEGRFAEARERMMSVVGRYRQTGMPWESAALAAAVGPIILMGDWDTALTDTERAVEIAVACPTFAGYELAQLLYLRTLMADERAPGMLDELAVLLPKPDQLNSLGSWHMLMAWVECAALLGQHERAAPHYDRVVELIDNGAVTTYYPVLLERIAGIAAFCGGRFDEANAHFDTAAHQAETLPFVSEQGEVRRWRALMLLRRSSPGDREAAREWLHEAIEAYRRYHMPKHEQMARRLLASI